MKSEDTGELKRLMDTVRNISKDPKNVEKSGFCHARVESFRGEDLVRRQRIPVDRPRTRCKEGVGPRERNMIVGITDIIPEAESGPLILVRKNIVRGLSFGAIK
jgi:hypothetical protein